MSAGSETKMLKVHFIPALSQTLSWELWERNKENTSSRLKQQSSVLMSHEALSPQTGSQVPWDMEGGHSQEHRARAKRRNFQREGDSHDPESLGTSRVPPPSPHGPGPTHVSAAKYLLLTCLFLLWFKFQAAHGFILPSPALRANHYGFYNPQSPRLTHSICTIFA